MKTFTSEMQKELTPIQALELLKEGNQRFINGNQASRDFLAQANETATAQYPFAVVLNCIDSRVSAEIIFDQGIGDIFSIRIAGNIINEDILGSMEFACAAAGSKMIVVLGHSSCGAVKGACDNVQLGNLTSLLDKVQPAIDAEKSVKEDRSSKNDDFVTKVTKINVKNAVNEILEKSPTLKNLVDQGTCGIVGGVHDLASGKIEFF